MAQIAVIEVRQTGSRSCGHPRPGSDCSLCLQSSKKVAGDDPLVVAGGGPPPPHLLETIYGLTGGLSSLHASTQANTPSPTIVPNIATSGGPSA
jgi:hypothetical protein